MSDPDQTSNLPLLERMDYARRVPGLPPMPRYLQWTTLLSRVAPGYIEALVGLAIATNPVGAPTPLLDWMTQAYGLTPAFWSIWLAVFGLIALMWSITGRWRYALLVRVIGAVITTFPLAFFIGLNVWHIFVVDTLRSRIAAVVYSGLYLLLIAGYAKSAGLALWFEEIRAVVEGQDRRG